MPNDYYPSDNSSDSSSPSESESDETDTKQEETDEGEALIPKSILGDRECKPGEKLTFEVTHVYGDEVSVKFSGYGKGSKSKDESSNSDSEEMDGAMDRMDEAMA